MNRSATAAPPELPGYTFERLLGSGGYADVFLYEKARPRMRVAVKVLRSNGSDGRSPELWAEADLMARVSQHPHIVTVHDTDVAPDGRPYLVMEYYPGMTLAERARAETIPVADVLTLGVQLGGAIETAHRFGIVHRDIKPANILTNEFRRPALTDFGIAGTGDDDPDDGGMSIPWAAPEVFRGHQVDGPRSDVYSLGATLWNLLTGRSPFEEPGNDNTPIALIRRIEGRPPPPTGREDVPDSLERVLQQAMAKRPEARFGSGLELARALQAIQHELGLSVVQPEIPQRENPDLVRRRHQDDADATDFRPRRVHAQDPGWPAAPAAGGTVPTVPTVPTAPVVPAGPTGPTVPTGRRAPDLPGPPLSASPRVGIPEPPPLLETVARRAAPAPDPQPAPQPEVSIGRRVAVLVGVALAAVGLTAGVLLWPDGADPGTTGAADGEPSAQSLLEPASVPVPDLSGTRVSPAAARFSWAVDDPSAVAFYLVTRLDRGSGSRPSRAKVTTRSLTLTGLVAADRPCLEVTAVDRDGSAGQPTRACV